LGARPAEGLLASALWTSLEPWPSACRRRPPGSEEALQLSDHRGARCWRRRWLHQIGSAGGAHPRGSTAAMTCLSGRREGAVWRRRWGRRRGEFLVRRARTRQACV